MKRILALFLIILTLFVSTGLLSSCETMLGPSNDDPSADQPSDVDPNPDPDPDDKPVHTHLYVDGFCDCGAIDPDYKPEDPPHKHSYVDGKCSCGAVDPDYDYPTPPHTHDYVDGKCSCGAEDPDYVEPTPPHTHNYVDGMCDCGAKDPYYVNPDDVNCSEGVHIDADNTDYCDRCNQYLVVVIDLYALNDLHGKFCDTDSQIGVDELGTYFNDRKKADDHVILMATGDMWQGTAESNLTKGHILTDWMNAMGFSSMTLGNHDFDWGTDAIKSNEAIADFPFLAINVFSVETGKRVDYCAPSVMIDRGGVQIGIIGAIGDCYSSISSDMVEDVYFKVGTELTNLVKAESERLRSLGADFIIYQLHDGYSSDNPMSNYYNSMLSSGGYVDVVFESHTHQSYVKTDSSGVYHLQAGGENKGLSHVEFKINYVTGNVSFTVAEIINTSSYNNLADDPSTEAIEDKYSDIINYAYSDLGYVSKYMSDAAVESYVASLYLEAGLNKWGSEYNIVLGGGFLRTRSPYNLSSGMVSYADILSLLPFDNRIVLCKVSGKNLLNKFINSTSSDYYVSMSDYGNSLSISSSSQYYIVVDTYTALYSPNGLTIVDYYDNTTFARDLFAEKVEAGELGGTANNNNNNNHENYVLTSITDANAIGKALSSNETTSQHYYIKGKIRSIVSTTYGNMYIEDEQGNSIYIYGLYDINGTRYDSMSSKPAVGDTIVVYAPICRYVNGSTDMVELKNAKIISTE